MDVSVLEILSERLVKPSTSTPPSLRCHKLSLNDQIQQGGYIPLAFFYPNLKPSDSPITRSTTESETSRILENALSKTLSCYYPFAGRLRDNLFIECNDIGVHFTVARFKCQMAEFQKLPNSQVKDLVFRKSLLSRTDGDASLLLVQLSYFECAGMAVTICMSHKLGDLSTLFTFFHDWAAMVHRSTHSPSPQFIGASLFPPVDDPSLLKEVSICGSENPAKKFLFHAPKIEQLKDMVATTCGVEKPTRVEVVTALLYRCALVSSREISGSFRPGGLVLPMNLRPVIVPPLPKDAVGNISTGLVIPTTKEEEITLPELISKLRNAKVNIQNEYKEKAKENDQNSPSVEVAKAQTNHNISNLDLYVCTSWCRYPFYDVDFGRGKPSSVSLPSERGSKNVFLLMDTRNEDAIEATVMLEEPQMSAFETNKELRAFASLSS